MQVPEEETRLDSAADLFLDPYVELHQDFEENLSLALANPFAIFELPVPTLPYCLVLPEQSVEQGQWDQLMRSELLLDSEQMSHWEQAAH